MARALLLLYLALGAVHVGAQALGDDAWAAVTQVLLMPVLAAFTAAVAPPSRLRTLLLAALLASWLGDSVPRLLDGDAAVVAMVAFFLLAQVAYVAAFRRYVEDSVLRQRRFLLLPYQLLVVLLIVVCALGAGVLAPAVVVYGLCLGAMAVLATGVHPFAWAGGVLFLVSDGLIALDAFATGLPGDLQDVVVMATYVVAQLLLVGGVLLREGWLSYDEEPATP
jgi:uncharacterized membrane protein YhhN